MILFPFSLCCLHKAMEEEKRRRKQGGGKRHFLYLVQTTNPPKLVSNPRDTGTSSQPHQYSVKLIFQRLLHSLQAVLPQFLEDFWFLTELSACQWSLRQNTSSSASSIMYLKRSSFKHSSMAPAPSLCSNWSEGGSLTHKPCSRFISSSCFCQTPLASRCSQKMSISGDPRVVPPLTPKLGAPLQAG